MPSNPGANPEDWLHFEHMLGLTTDLLPVVSDQSVPISPDSKMVGLGKTPSRINRNGHAAGIADWTSQTTTSQQIAAWARDSRLGICVQTRHLRALDIDVSDPAAAQAIEDMVGMLGHVMPVRYRPDSGKRLLAFYLPGELGKRTMKVDGGIIEFLANGQQFIAVGTHPEGKRYIWRGSQGINGTEGALPLDFPTLSLEQFEELWLLLESMFATEDSVTGNPIINRHQTKDIRYDDWVSTYLRGSSWFRGEDTDGRVNIQCPWKAGHSGDSGETETSYFPAGSNNIAAGHFKCLHASCASRTDGDFLASTGAGADGFEVLPDLPGQVPEVKLYDWHGSQDESGSEAAPLLASNVILLHDHLPLPVATHPGVLPSLVRTDDGKVKALIENVAAVLPRGDIMGFEIARDNFRDEIVLGSHSRGWQRMADAHMVEMRLRLARIGFQPVAQEMIRHAVIHLANKNRFDSAQMWLNGWVWDGVCRVHDFMCKYLGTEDSAYARAIGAYLWSAMAGRILQPGVQADIIPIFVGEGGVGKTSMVRLLPPDVSMFMEISLTDTDDNLSRRMRGKLVGEVAELRGLHTKEMEGIKAWASRCYESFVPKYVEYEITFPRRVVCVGTTDKDEFLADHNNRRWAPIKVGSIDVDGIKLDRNQLWAEGAAIFSGVWVGPGGTRLPEGGVQWRDLHRLAKFEHGSFAISDNWTETVTRWLSTKDVMSERIPGNDRYLLINDVFLNALKMEPKVVKMNDMVRLGKILRELGYENKPLRIDGKLCKVWLKKIADEDFM